MLWSPRGLYGLPGGKLYVDVSTRAVLVGNSKVHLGRPWALVYHKDAAALFVTPLHSTPIYSTQKSERHACLRRCFKRQNLPVSTDVNSL